ncbi:MAG: efflux RND transporter periplasmic adaptor subunit [Verrucomicrobia bacterium]|nr:efflux RND transporter periplasmic adaptor subunit [Verrucomicrobiota bacterium]
MKVSVASPSFWLVLCVTVLITNGCQKSSPPPPAAVPTVTVAKVISKEVIEWDEYTGRTDAIESVDIRPRVSGYLEMIGFRAGDIVDKGDLLFEIDPRPYQATLDQAKGQLEQAEAQKKLNDANFARAQELIARNVTAKSDYDNAVAQKNGSDAQVSTAQAAVEAAQLNLDFTKVTAPITGRISRELVTVGNLVQADTTVLTNIVSVNPVYAYFNVDANSVEKYIQHIREGDLQDARKSKVSIYMKLESESGFPHEGYIDFINNQFTASTGTLQIRGVFGNPDGYIEPGQFVLVRVAGTPKHQAVLVSDRAIGSDQGQKFVFVVDGQGTVQSQRIVTGPIVDGLRIVRSGLKGDEQVIVAGTLNARPGGKVKVETADMNSFASDQLAISTKVKATK